MSIQETARKLACGDCDICKGEPQPCGGGQSLMYRNCLKIAAKQREIDIQQAVVWLQANMETNCFGVPMAKGSGNENHLQFIARFKKAMEGRSYGSKNN